MKFDSIVREILTAPSDITQRGENIHIRTESGASVIIDPTNRVSFFSSLRKSFVIDGFIIGIERVAHSKEWMRIANGPIGKMIQNMSQAETEEGVRLSAKLD